MPPMPHVVIIGAGVAGASAAATLADAGWRVTLVDKAARPGGRCATRRLAADTASPWFDYGAQYFTARDPAFRQAIASDLDAGALCHWRPMLHVAEHGDAGWRRTPSPDERERLIGPRGLNHWIRYRLDQTTADIQCRRRVSAVARTAQGWQLQFADDAASQNADALIVTLPAVQAAGLLGDLADDMPELAAADSALSPCHSLVVAAPALADCHGIFVKGGHLAWCADNTHKAGHGEAGTHLWTLHAGPSFSADHLEDDPQTIARMLIEEFAALGGLATARIKPVHQHRWRYARPGAKPPPADTRCLARPELRLALAGDWLAGGRIEGAWHSGRAAADALR